MNRAERRHPPKAGQVRQILDDLNKIEKIKQAMNDSWPFRPGDKVMLNMDAITSRKGYDQKLPAYKAFCESNTGQVFTVEYVEGMHPSVVCLAEDESTPKWLFWVGDLKAV
jgi:hypothetical protein